MAEGGHEMFHDYNCSVCIRDKDAYSYAAYYCPQCNEYFCKQCFVQSGCAHDGPLGRGNVAKWGKASKRVDFDECSRHKGNTIQLYCQQDDTVACSVCSQSHHKACGDLKYIPLVASGMVSKEIVKTAQTDLQQLRDRVEQLLQDKTTHQGDLQNIRKQLVAEIKEERDQLIAMIDTLERQSLEELNKIMSGLNDKVKSDLQLLNSTKAELLDLQTRLSKPNIDESLLFSRLKLSTELIQDKNQEISDIFRASIPDKVRFNVDIKIKEHLQGMRGLGELVSERQTQRPRHLSEKGQGPGNPRITLHKPYTLKQKNVVDVKIKGDKKTCAILGLCQLSDGSIVLTDYDNKKLKRLDRTYKVINHYPLSASPCDVCETEVGEVAVAMQGNTIQCVSVGDKMTATHSFSTKHDCYSLAYHSKCLYVISLRGSAVYVYTPSGSLLNTISTDQHGSQLFSDTRHITVSPDSGHLYVAEGEKGLVTLDRKCNLLATFNPPELMGALAVCLDGVGNVFVRGFGPGKVLQVSKEGDRQVAQILFMSDGINGHTLCFDNVTTSLFISELALQGCDKVHVVHLTQLYRIKCDSNNMIA